MTDFGPPVGFTPQGDMTPFTRFNNQGDFAPLITNARGDVVPFEFTNFAPDGTPSPFTFDANGNRIPNVYEMYPQMNPNYAAAAAHAAAVSRRKSGTETPAQEAAFLLLL